MHSKMSTSWCSGCYPHGLVENDSHVLPWKKTCCVVTCRTHARCFQVNSLVWQAYCRFCSWIPLCQVGSASGNHFGSLLANRFRRPTWRNGYTWVMILPVSSAWRIFLRWYRVLVTKIIPPNKSYLKKHLQHQDQRGSLMLLPGTLFGSLVLHPSGKERRHHCLRQDLGAILSTQSSSVLFLNAWSCLFQVKRSYQASKKLSPRARTNSLLG